MSRVEFSLDGRPHIDLIKLLKASGVVRSGGQAQQVVESGQVFRRGVPEFRKRTKIVPGEVVCYSEFEILVLP